MNFNFFYQCMNVRYFFRQKSNILVIHHQIVELQRIRFFFWKRSIYEIEIIKPSEKMNNF